MRAVIHLVGALALALTVACGGGDSAPVPAETAEAPGAAPTPPTTEQIARSTITGIFEEGPITLVDGRWEGEPYEEGAATIPVVELAGSEDFLLVGDLDGDSAEEAIVHLTYNSGGTGNFGFLVALGRDGDEAVQEALGEIGDRVQIRGARIEDSRIVLDVIQAGPGDGMCCPTELATLTFTAEGDRLVAASTVTGSASLETLGGGEWVLLELSGDEAAPAEPELTLAFEDGSVHGSSGCNTFRGSVEVGEPATSFSIGPLAGTRMACPPEVMDLEQRYLAALQSAEGWSFRFSRLEIGYVQDDAWQRLVFESR